MATRNIVGLLLTGLALAWFPAGTTSAGELPAAPGGERKAGGLVDLLELISKPTFPSLSGLIRPEKMGILTDNPCEIENNDVEAELMSGNQTRILSGIHILSGISVEVHVTVQSGNDGTSKDAASKDAASKDGASKDAASTDGAKKTDDKRHAKKSRKNKARSKSDKTT